MDTNQHQKLIEAEQKKLSGQHKEALKLCEQVLVCDLECVEAYEEIADNYLSLREYERAKKALDRALSLQPGSANANYLMGFVYSTAEQWKEAIALLERADVLQPNHPEILRCLGWAMYQNGQRKRGIIILERAVNLAPNDCLILCDLGICYLNERQFTRAMELFNRILEIEPTNEKARECLQTARFFQKEYKKVNKKK